MITTTEEWFLGLKNERMTLVIRLLKDGREIYKKNLQNQNRKRRIKIVQFLK
jgi:hypothetical protein